MIRKIIRLFKTDIEKRIGRVEDRILEYLRPYQYRKLWVHHFGATYIHPRHLAICICVATDLEREEVIKLEIDSRIRIWLNQEGYPTEAIKDIGVSVDSQETVDREWGGDWYHYYK